ncbi:hypothetical protein HKD37_15G043806 [Glycine soja]
MHEQCTNSNSKRTKLYVIGEYSLPSNLETSIGVSKSDTPTQIPCPIGQKAIKRKMKGKRDVASSLIVDLFGMEYSVVGILGSTISFDLLCIRTMSHVVMSYGSKTGGDSSNVKKRISTCDVEALKNV